MSLKDRSEQIDWSTAEKYLQHSRFQPIYDRAFYRLIEELSGKQNYSSDIHALRDQFIRDMDKWLNSSKLNKISGLEQFQYRDAIIGVTHSLDDLHVTHGKSLVVFAKSYPYHTRMRPDMTIRTLETLSPGDVLVFESPFSYYGDLHPQVENILNRCLELRIPVHIDAAWYGCSKNFEFDYSHPAIKSVSFSLSKGLGLGSHRTGIRYSRERWAGPVTIMNDFNMCVASVMWYGINFMKQFPIDYAQDKYGEAYDLICEKLNLKKTKTIHIAYNSTPEGSFPVGIRPFLRFLADNIDEFK